MARVRSRRRGGTARLGLCRRHVTLRTPCMIVRCGSHTKWYVPFFNFTVHFVVPVPATLVFLSTPGPVRWKSWIDARSRMVITYVPAFTVFLFIEIVKPGPTLPVSVFALVAAKVGPASASVARSVMRNRLAIEEVHDVVSELLRVLVEEAVVRIG